MSVELFATGIKARDQDFLIYLDRLILIKKGP